MSVARSIHWTKLKRQVVGVGLLVALVTGTSANAQETVLALEFDFSNPGARSMGFGNTFTALADDATAAFANPAGLTQLLRPEVSAEWRYWKYSTRYTSGGRLSGEPTGVGIDTSAGLRFEESSESLSGLSFLSFVYPQDRWSVAFFGHQLANFRFTSQTDGFIRDVQGPVPGGMERFPEQRAETEFEIITYGFAAAFQILDNLSIGLGLNYFDGNMDSRSTLYQALTVFDPHPFRAEDVQFSTLFEIDGSDLGMGVGVLWKMSDVWSWGAFYREGPEFDISGTAIAGPRSGLPEGTQIFDASSPIAMPDAYGLGVAFRSKGGHLTLSFEWNRVEYASIVDSLDRDAFGLLPTLNDGDEFHFGGEYAFLNQEPVVALRIGVWLDPDHQLRATEDSPAIVKALRQPGEDEMHFAAGLGVAFSTFQIDLGVDLSDLVNTASLSMIYSF